MTHPQRQHHSMHEMGGSRPPSPASSLASSAAATPASMQGVSRATSPASLSLASSAASSPAASVMSLASQTSMRKLSASSDLTPISSPSLSFVSAPSSPCQSAHTPRQQNRSKRVPLSSEQKSVLEQFFLNNPYPSREEKSELGSRVGLGVDKVHKWYDNRRTKANKDKRGKQRPLATGAESYQNQQQQQQQQPLFQSVNRQQLTEAKFSQAVNPSQPLANYLSSLSYQPNPTATPYLNVLTLQQLMSTNIFGAASVAPLINPQQQSPSQAQFTALTPSVFNQTAMTQSVTKPSTPPQPQPQPQLLSAFSAVQSNRTLPNNLSPLTPSSFIDATSIPSLPSTPMMHYSNAPVRPLSVIDSIANTSNTNSPINSNTGFVSPLLIKRQRLGNEMANNPHGSFVSRSLSMASLNGAAQSIFSPTLCQQQLPSQPAFSGAVHH